MDGNKRFEFLEHTADAYVAAYGKNMEEAFENAALAMFEVMTDTGKITQTTEDQFEIEAPDECALLYNWLEELLVRFEIRGMLCSKFRVTGFQETPQGFALKAQCWGEKYDSKKHSQKVGVKAVTYHRMEINRKPNETIVKFILDI